MRKTELKKTGRFLTAVISICMLLSMSTAALAGSWEQYQSGEWVYHNDDGSLRTSEWLESGGNLYYFGPDSLLLTNNYTPDGYWVNRYGTYESWWGQRTDAVVPRTGVPYTGSYIYTFSEDVYGDGVHHWSVTERTLFGGTYQKQYEMYPLSPFSFELMDIVAGSEAVGYVSFSPDGNIAYISMGGYTQRCTS